MIELAAVYRTAPYVQKELGLSRFQLALRIERGILPGPTFIDDNNVRYFSDNWLVIAKKTLERNYNHPAMAAESGGRECGDS